MHYCFAGLCLPASARVRAEYRDLFPERGADTGSKEGRAALLAGFQAQLREWAPILQRFLKNEDDQVRTKIGIWVEWEHGWGGILGEEY